MNMIAPIERTDDRPARTQVAGLVALAARRVAPLWPLESAIAVNPLAGFEELPFAQAVAEASSLFGAHRTLPLALWRRLLDNGRIEEAALRDAAIGHLGGIYRAAAPIAPGVTMLDALMACLLVIGRGDRPERRAGLGPDAAFIAKWCGAFFDHGLTAMPLPNRDLGLYRAVLAMAAYDPDYRTLTGARGAALLLSVPRDPLEAISEGLASLEAEVDPLAYLSGLVARLPGWAGHIRWRSEHADADRVADAPATMADLVALWILLARADALSAPLGAPSADKHQSAALLAHFGLTAKALGPRDAQRLDSVAEVDDDRLGALFMMAAERSYANGLMPALQRAARTSNPPARPDAQLVFCIDVRSEPFRRALEAEGNYETFGYAGFFGLPIALHPFAGAHRARLLPVLLSPRHDISERPVPGRESEAEAIADRARGDACTTDLFAAAKAGPATAFAAAEATGPLAAALMLARTFAPRATGRAAAALRTRRQRALAPAGDAHEDHAGFALADKIGYASALFRLTGLQPDTARLVVLTGHGASAVNNPYAAALDCGACGGHAGGANARLLAAMLNDEDVRSGLAKEGIALPGSTYFLAAEHNTTTDEVVIFDADRIPPTHAADLAALSASLARAAETNRARRALLLGRAPGDLLTGAVHWGEVRPEWGLAGNAAFIVGPRDLTRMIDLQGRAFLHSYDWRTDTDGSALATILTAPMVVAQWINCQYLFSTIDNQNYGSGDKVTQNVIGGIGVVQGNGGDLKIGLPRQSLFCDDGLPHHIPQRLLTVVQAPFDRVAALVESSDILRRLFGKGWVQLIVIEPETARARRWREDGADCSEGRSLLAIDC